MRNIIFVKNVREIELDKGDDIDDDYEDSIFLNPQKGDSEDEDDNKGNKSMRYLEIMGEILNLDGNINNNEEEEYKNETQGNYGEVLRNLGVDENDAGAAGNEQELKMIDLKTTISAMKDGDDDIKEEKHNNENYEFDLYELDDAAAQIPLLSISCQHLHQQVSDKEETSMTGSAGSKSNAGDETERVQMNAKDTELQLNFTEK